MEQDQVKEIAREWVLTQSKGYSDDSPSNAPDINLLAINHPDICWKVIIEIFSSTSDEWVLENLAAGPIESLLVLHGDIAMDWVAKEASLNNRFRLLLNDVWKSSMKDDVWERLKNLAK